MYFPGVTVILSFHESHDNVNLHVFLSQASRSMQTLVNANAHSAVLLENTSVRHFDISFFMKEIISDFLVAWYLIHLIDVCVENKPTEYLTQFVFIVF